MPDFNLTEWAKRKEDEFMSHVSDEVQQLAIICQADNKEIPLDIYRSMRLNSYEQKLLHGYLSNEALVWVIENAMHNSLARNGRWHVPVVYDEYLLSDGLSELLARFKKLVKQ